MLLIRKATPDDNQGARELVLRSLSDYGIAVEFDGLDRAIGHIGTAQSSNAIELVADWNGCMCACIAFQTMANRDGKLFGFHVDHAHRGKGIGKSLLNAAIAEAKQYGYIRLRLDTWDNMHAALALYVSAGWQRDADPPPESGANRSYFLQLCID